MNQDAYQATQREAATLGLSLALLRNRKHRVLQVSDNAGRSGLLVVPRSGSDRRGQYNARANLRRLVQLAHPDKHGGSVAAAEATRWLLENRP